MFLDHGFASKQNMSLFSDQKALVKTSNHSALELETIDEPFNSMNLSMSQSPLFSAKTLPLFETE